MRETRLIIYSFQMRDLESGSSHRKAVIKGTHIAVEFVINLLAQGWSESEIARNYPGVTREDILACFKYAGETLQAAKLSNSEIE
jgi:uncharacterized protein (DUF433 family)